MYGGFYASGVLLFITYNIDYMKESKIRGRMCNPVGYWAVKAGKCMYIGIPVAYSNTEN